MLLKNKFDFSARLKIKAFSYTQKEKTALHIESVV